MNILYQKNIFMFYHAIIFSMIIISCDYKHRYRHRNTDIDDWIWFCKSQFIEMWFDMHENILMLFLTVSQLHLIIFKLGVRLFSMHKMISWFTVTWLLQLWSICQSMFSRIKGSTGDSRKGLFFSHMDNFFNTWAR